MCRAAFVCMLSVASGCAHKFETSQFDQATWQPTGRSVQGIIYYEPVLVLQSFEYSALVKDGKVIGRESDGTCEPVVQKQEIVVLPDYENPRVVMYKPSIFAAGKFGVSLSNGLLAGVNTESTPQLPSLIEQISGAGILGGPTKGSACNAAPVLRSAERLELE